MAEQQEAVTEVDETQSQPAGTEAPPATPRTYTQDEVDALARKIRKNTRYAVKKEVQDEFARRSTEAPAREPAPQPKSDEPKAPRREDFEDYESYIDARAAHTAEQRAAKAVDDRLKADQDRRRKETESTQQQQRQEQFQTKIVTAGREKFKDFDDALATLMESEDVMQAASIGPYIMESDKGPELTHYLGTHLDEAERIAGLKPMRQAAALAEIERKLAVKSSTAPEPIKPVGNRGSSSALPSDDDDISTWMAKERKRLGRK